MIFYVKQKYTNYIIHIMEKIKILMVYNERGRSQTLSEHFNLFGIETQVVHSLQEGLDLEANYDLLMVDVDIPLIGNESIIGKKKSVECFLGAPFPVFNFLQKTTKPVFLCDTWREVDVKAKLDQLSIVSTVVYVRAPQLMESGYLPLVFSLLGEDSDKVLYTVFLWGFDDELKNRPQTVHLTSLLLRAYNKGRIHALVGDDAPSIDYRPIEEILHEIRNN